MTKLVENITDDDLGYAGILIPAGAHVEVEDHVAETMVEGNPTKFRLLETGNVVAEGPGSASAAPEGVENRAVDTRGQVCPIHGNRHYYNAQGVCRCGYVNVKE